MMSEKFERQLAYFCSPVLMRKKVSNLVSISKRELDNIDECIDYYTEKLEKFGISVEKLCECDNRTLLLVYDRPNLSVHLRLYQNSQFLKKYGYKDSYSLNKMMSILKDRIARTKFPHEIGVFLGYPICDIVGFVENKGKNYRLNGYWKVYGDIHGTKKLFDMYDELRNILIFGLNDERSLLGILDKIHKNKRIA